MAKTTRKCAFCKIDDTQKDDMEVVVSGEKRPIYKYYHKDPCYPRFLKQQAFREQERQELDELSETIMGIYGVKALPSAIFPLLQDLRNGTKFFGKQDYKYKQGYSYHLIAETFRYCSDTIEYYNAKKNFNGFTHAFRYGLAIVCDKLMVVEGMQTNREQQQKMAEKHLEQVGDSGEQYESSYQPKKATKKPLDFLDD